MNTEQSVILKLCSCVQPLSAPNLDGAGSIDWNVVHQMAADSKIDGIVYPTVALIRGDNSPDPDILDRWKKNIIPQTLRQMGANWLTGRLAAGLGEAGIPYVVFKGLILADLYPSPDCRFSVDSDILVDAFYAQATAEVLSKNGFVYVKENSKENVPFWRCPGRLSLELHYRLWEDYDDEKTRMLDKMGLTRPESLISLSSSYGGIVTMGHTEHLIFQVFHIIKHMTFMGISLRNFLDTALFVNRYMEELDMERFWRSMEALGYASFCDAMFRTCVQYLGMTRKALMPRHENDVLDEERFMTDIFDLCIKNRDNESLNVASMTVYQMYHEASEKPVGGGKTWLKLLFPGRNAMARRYSYARKHPFLLPVAWIHRGLHSLFTRKSDTGGLQKSLQAADEKVRLLKRFGLFS